MTLCNRMLFLLLQLRCNFLAFGFLQYNLSQFNFLFSHYQQQPYCLVPPNQGSEARASSLPYLFILVAQNLTTNLNYARQLDLVPGFHNNLRQNFNHLMYADGLLIITNASRKAARNVKLCLNVYSHLVGQVPNLSKSEIYFPNWFNRRVSHSICSILQFNPGKTPFKYLGFLFLQKFLTLFTFNL